MMNKIFSIATAAAVLFSSNGFSETGETIVDTNFSLTAGDDVLTDTHATQPLKTPSSTEILPPSTITIGKLSLGNLTPPYALVTVLAQENSPKMAATAKLVWNLAPLHLTSGRYVITFNVVLVEPSAQGGIFIVGLGDKNGRRVRTHWTHAPMTIAFKSDKLWATGKGGAPLPVAARDISAVTISFDLDAKNWSASANGAILTGETPFPDDLESDGQLQVISLEFGSIGGRGDAPGGVYAISNVKMTRLP